MSISPRSARVDLLRLLAAATFLAASNVGCANGADGVANMLSPAEIAALKRSAQMAARQQDDLPNDSTASIAWVGPLRRDLPGDDGRVAAIAVVRFTGLANRYCRVFVSSGDLAVAMIVPVPATANYDHCIEAGPLRIVDLDGDGLVDLVHSVKVRSNRYPAAASETVVYLGRRDGASGFCYSTQASRELAGVDTRTVAALASASASALKRIGKARFACDAT